MTSIILSAAARLMVALMLMFSVYLLLRGHNDPGGGFIGGLVGATAFILLAKGMGLEVARRAMRVDPRVLACVGLGASVAAGLMAWLQGHPFLTGLWMFIGATEGDKGIPISSVLLFDVGVYLVVVGAVMTFLFALEEGIDE